MSCTRKHLRRRDFVRRIGSAALALPLLERFDGQLRAQVNNQKRSKYVVFLYTNDGVHNRNFWPTSADPTSSPTLSVAGALQGQGAGARAPAERRHRRWATPA